MTILVSTGTRTYPLLFFFQGGGGSNVVPITHCSCQQGAKKAADDKCSDDKALSKIIVPVAHTDRVVSERNLRCRWRSMDAV